MLSRDSFHASYYDPDLGSDHVAPPEFRNRSPKQLAHLQGVIARLAKRAGVKGTMLAIQKAARQRSQEKLPATWEPVQAAAQEHLRRLGCGK